MKATKPWGKLVCFVLCCGMALWLTACSNSKKEIRAESLKGNMITETHTDTQCIGRFQLNVPDALAVAGRSQSIYRVDVSTVPLPPGGVGGLWHDRLAQIRTLTPPRGMTDVVIRSFELEPGVPAAWYFKTSYAPELRDLAAVKPERDHAVLVSRGGEAGKEGAVETLVKNVLDAYIPGVKEGFCVGYGSVTSEPGLNESSGIAFDHKQVTGFEITFDTQTVKEPDTHTFSNLDEEKEVATANGGSLAVLLNQKRSLAGLEGKEIRISVVSPKETPLVRFTWHFPGVPADSFRPMINLKGVAPLSEQKSLETIWESLLKSLRAVPPSSTHVR